MWIPAFDAASSSRRALSSRLRANRSNNCRTRGSAATAFARRKNATPSRSSFRTAASETSYGSSAVTIGPPEYGWGWKSARPLSRLLAGRCRPLDAPAELFLRQLRHHLWGPRRVPNDVDVRLPDSGEGFDFSLHVLVQVPRGGTPGRCQRHPDRDLALRLVQLDVVHEPEIVDVDRDFRVVALLEDADDLF